MIFDMEKIKEIIPPIIDNQLEEMIDIGLKRKFKKHKTFDYFINEVFEIYIPETVRICTGYFSPKVWEKIGGAFSKIGKSTDGTPVFKLLIGSEPKIFSEKDLQKWFDEQLRKELDELDLSIELQLHIRSLINFLNRNDVQVGLQNRPFIHAKLYHFDKFAIIGSSNLTKSGLTSNTELNIPIYDNKQIKALTYWYDKIFNRADLSYKQRLIDALKNCKLGTREWTPYEVYVKMLYESLKLSLSFEKMRSGINFQLTIYQQEGVSRILKAIENFGGAILADSVGLGKSPQALDVISKLQSNYGKREALIICPSQLEENWKNLVSNADIWAQVFSMETLPRRLPKKSKFDIIVVDESHNFRNLKSKRYKQLELLLTKNPNSVVLLLTATPINTSLKDLYSQLMLITKSNESYSPFYNIGIYNLTEYFKNIEKGIEDISKLRDHIIISRSRREIRLRQKLFGIDLTIGGIPLKFPERKLEVLNYNITDKHLSGMTSEKFYEYIIELFDKLKFPYYNLEKYIIEGPQDNAKKVLGENLSAITKVLLLKRLESSLYCFNKSLQAQKRLNQIFKELIINKIFLKTSDIWKIFEEIDPDEEEANIIEIIIEKLHDDKYLVKKEIEVNKRKFDVYKIIQDLKSDKDIIHKVLDVIKKVMAHEDQKLIKLFNKIEELKEKKIIIFSYFKDTIDYLYDEYLKYSKRGGIAKITGNTSKKERNYIITHFAPISNLDINEFNEKFDKSKEIRILFSTDVLAEGQNLQDASVCINYDLHWNPVKIIQRIGRIDRLKSPHKEIYIFNCFPESGLETMLSLVSRLIERLRTIDQVLELDGVVLTGDELIRKKNQLNRLKSKDITVLDELDAEVELLTDDKARELLIKEIFEV
ncbi:MAG: helicase-related protein, partial [Candidatus Helarchaeota archaeon]